MGSCSGRFAIVTKSAKNKDVKLNLIYSRILFECNTGTYFLSVLLRDDVVGIGVYGH